MSETLTVTIDGWSNGAAIPEKFAFCAPCAETHARMSNNISPAISWSGAPEGTRSFAVLCVDVDVPSVGDDVNQEERTISTDLPRVDFYHWVLVDIPSTVNGLAEAADSDGITAGGKAPGATANGVRGVNNYTDWFSGDPDMGGDYGGYDGPCPPWNDERLHHYHFRVYALDVADLGLGGVFGGPDVVAAMDGHILAEGSYLGTYTQFPGLMGG